MAVTNEFCWSKTRDENFRDCLRKYFFHYYGAWGGWEPSAAPRTRQLYILKNLQPRMIWARGHVAHAIRAILAEQRAGGAPAMVDAATEKMLEAMRREFRDSLARRYQQFPRKVCGLFEHEYELKISNEQWKETADHAVHCLQTFLNSDIYGKLKSATTKAWLEQENPASFTLDGIKVYVQLDFAQRTTDSITLYNWKTGQTEDTNAELRLVCYTLYAGERWKVSPEQVSVSEFNLATGAVITRNTAAADLEVMKDYIRDSADEMSFLLEDVKHNQPQPETAFDFAEDRTACYHCNFLKICPRWIEEQR